MSLSHRPVAKSPPAALRALIARLERGPARARAGVLPFGDARLDSCLPQGGLPLGRWHEIVGDGLERELPAAATGFAACLARRCAESGAKGSGTGVVLWALRRDDVHPPALEALGLDPDRLIYVRADRDAELLNVIEAALRTRGVDAVVGEVERIDLPDGKRLQLACEQGGATAFLLRRRIHGRPSRQASARSAEASAAATRWRVAPAPSGQDAADEPGLGSPRWSARLERCRGGRTGRFLMEMNDATRDVRVVAELADHETEASDGGASAGLSSGVSSGAGDDGAGRGRAAAHGG